MIWRIFRVHNLCEERWTETLVWHVERDGRGPDDDPHRCGCHHAERVGHYDPHEGDRGRTRPENVVQDSSQNEMEGHHGVPVMVEDEVRWAEGQTCEDGGQTFDHGDVE